MLPADIITIHAPAGTKARWIRSARPGKLSTWVCKMIDEPADPRRYVANAVDGLPSTLDELESMLTAAYLAGARRE
jgi:hypothetical protein